MNQENTMLPPFTYGMMLNALQNFTPEQLNMNVTVHDFGEDETYPVLEFLKVGEEQNKDIGPQDTLDSGHPYLVF